MSHPEVIRLTDAHFHRAREMFGRAFYDYPLLTYVVPDPAKRLRPTEQLYAAVMRYCLLYGEAYTTSDVRGAACWLPPERAFPSFLGMVRAGMLWLPFQFGWKGFSRLNAFDAVALRLHHTHAPGRHWYLWAIGVEPEHQGKGLGGKLMQPILSRADADGVPCYLETHKETNVPIYERYGFRVVERSEVPGHPGSIWGMLRPVA